MSEAPHSLTDSFSDEQQQYLAGFLHGTETTRSLQGLPTFAGILSAQGGAPASFEGPDKLQLEAWAKAEKNGKKLTPEEKAKREKHPFERFEQIQDWAQRNEFPKGTDVLMWKYHGLFYVAPAQDSFMCRMRFYGGLISSAQLRATAQIADEFGGPYTDITTRGNLQIREIPAAKAADFLMTMQENGLVSRGSGADNIRNVTGSATAGIDPQELYDTRHLAREMHHAILNDRTMYGLPRKFNIAFDGGGAISTLEDTNDIGFSAVKIEPGKTDISGKAISEGVYFRVAFGGITGHKDFAIDEGLLLRADQLISFAKATVRVFIQHGDRTDRKKARLKYVLDDWGHEKFVGEVLKEWGDEAISFPLSECEPRPQIGKSAHIGWHSQKQNGLNYLGVVFPVGRITTDQMRGLAKISDIYGDGDLRLTVWQNLLICNIRDEEKSAVEAAVEALGLQCGASNVRSGLVACTGAAGCKFANAYTKQNALEVASHLEGSVALDSPVNIHLTGCPNSCAQHYIGDIGFLGTKVEKGDDMVSGYHLFLGGGYGENRAIAREVLRGIEAEKIGEVTERLLKAYLRTRNDATETFYDWTRRFETDELKGFCAT